MRLPKVVHGDARTDTIEAVWQPEAAVPEAAWRAGAAGLAASFRPTGSTAPGFRLNARPALRVRSAGEDRLVPVDPSAVQEVDSIAPGGRARDGTPAVLVDLDGRSIEVALSPPPAVEVAGARAAEGGLTTTAVVAPMPGTVLAVRVERGQLVAARDTLVVLEAMKMENAVTAPSDSRVERVLVKPGQPVQRGDVLVELS